MAGDTKSNADLHRGRPKKSPIFGPIGKVGPEQDLKKAKRRTKRKADALPSESKLKKFPTLKSYTPAQRKTIIREQGKAVQQLANERGHASDELKDRRAGAKKTADKFQRLADNLNKQDRKQLSILKRVVAEDLLATDAKHFRELTGARKVKNGAEQGRALREFLAPGRAEIKSYEPKKGMKLKGTVKVAGVPLPGVHQLGFFADRGIDQLVRPSHGLAGAAYALHEGDNVLKGARDSFLAKPHRTRTFSDVLGQTGSTGAEKAVGGLVGDILTDPLNLATAGVKPVAELSIKGAIRLSSRADELRAIGKAAEAEKLMVKADKLILKAQKQASNKGLQVGVRLPGGKTFKTSGATTARISKVTGLSRGSTKFRELGPVQAVGQRMAPDFRPAGVTTREWEASRTQQRQARATTTQGSKHWERRGRAYVKETKAAAKTLGIKPSAVHRQIVDAIERAPLNPTAPRLSPIDPTNEIASLKTHASYNDLPAELKPIARAFRKDLRQIGKAEYDAKALGAVIPNYVPHQWDRAARKANEQAKKSSGRNPYAARRDDHRPISEQNAEMAELGQKGKFHTNLPLLVAERGVTHASVMGARQLSDGIVREVGRPFTKVDELRGVDDVYVDGQKGLRRVSQRGQAGEQDINRALGALQPGERLVVVPKPIGDLAVGGAVKGLDKDSPLRWYDQFMGKMKSVLTVWNVPAYELRNMSGDLWHAYQADTSPAALATASKLATLRVKRNLAEGRRLEQAIPADSPIDLGQGLTMRAEDLINEMESVGAIGTGFNGSELDEFARLAGEETTTKGTRMGPTEMLRRAGGHREDWVRMGTYVSARRKGMTPAEASDWTNRHHFDYADLTETERNVMRRAIPFYTFAARNTRLQASKVLERPGKFANYGLAQEEGRKQAGLDEDWEKELPGYQRRGLPIPVKIGDRQILLSPQLPITDLQRLGAIGDLDEQYKLTAQMITPPAKWALETGLNYSMFFREPLWQDAANPEAAHYVPAPSWVKHLPMSVRVAMAGGKKEAAEQGMWTAKADYWNRVTPQQNFLTSALTEKQKAGDSASSRNQGQTDAIISQLSGVKLNKYDPVKNKVDALYEARDVLKGKQADMRKLGLDADEKGYQTPEYIKSLKLSKDLEKKIDKAKAASGVEQREPAKKRKKPRKVTPGSEPSFDSDGPTERSFR